jgi:transposase
MERAFLEEQLTAGRSLEQIGAAVGKHPSTVGYWLKKHGLEAAHRAKFSARGGIERPRLAALVDRGLTTRAIARECSVSYSTAPLLAQAAWPANQAAARGRHPSSAPPGPAALPDTRRRPIRA